MIRTNLNKSNSMSESLLIDLPNLFQGSDSPKEIECEWDPSGIETSYSTAKKLVGTILVDALNEKISISGKINLYWVGPCRRCLEEAKGETQIFLQEIFERDASEGETFEFPNGEKLDLKPMLSEQALLYLPLAPLCSDTCKGPAGAEFPFDFDQKHSSQSGPSNVMDPRWAALNQLKFDNSGDQIA